MGDPTAGSQQLTILMQVHEVYHEVDRLPPDAETGAPMSGEGYTTDGTHCSWTCWRDECV